MGFASHVAAAQARNAVASLGYFAGAISLTGIAIFDPADDRRPCGYAARPASSTDVDYDFPEMPRRGSQRCHPDSRLEAQIDELTEVIESCRKIILVSKVAIAAGGIWLLAFTFGGITFDSMATSARFQL
jgi:hypothetical protein